MKPLLRTINPMYFYRILDWRKQSYQLVGSLAKVNGFDRYNKLIDLNCVFSQHPHGNPVDRTRSIPGPFAFAVQRPWQAPQIPTDLDQVIQTRTAHYIDTDKKLNLCWSGGIDSTCLVTGFLQQDRKSVV